MTLILSLLLKRSCVAAAVVVLEVGFEAEAVEVRAITVAVSDIGQLNARSLELVRCRSMARRTPQARLMLRQFMQPPLLRSLPKLSRHVRETSGARRGLFDSRRGQFSKEVGKPMSIFTSKKISPSAVTVH